MAYMLTSHITLVEFGRLSQNTRGRYSFRKDLAYAPKNIPCVLSGFPWRFYKRCAFICMSTIETTAAQRGSSW